MKSDFFVQGLIVAVGASSRGSSLAMAGSSACCFGDGERQHTDRRSRRRGGRPARARAAAAASSAEWLCTRLRLGRPAAAELAPYAARTSAAGRNLSSAGWSRRRVCTVRLHGTSGSGPWIFGPGSDLMDLDLSIYHSFFPLATAGGLWRRRRWDGLVRSA